MAPHLAVSFFYNWNLFTLKNLKKLGFSQNSYPNRIEYVWRFSLGLRCLASRPVGFHVSLLASCMTMAEACLIATREQSSGTERQQIKAMHMHSTALVSCIWKATVCLRATRKQPSGPKGSKSRFWMCYWSS